MLSFLSYPDVTFLSHPDVTTPVVTSVDWVAGKKETFAGLPHQRKVSKLV